MATHISTLNACDANHGTAKSDNEMCRSMFNTARSVLEARALPRCDLPTSTARLTLANKLSDYVVGDAVMRAVVDVSETLFRAGGRPSAALPPLPTGVPVETVLFSACARGGGGGGDAKRAHLARLDDEDRPRKLTHTVHTSKHPAYPARGKVNNPDWDVPERGYAPTDFTSHVVIANGAPVNPKGWADPAEWTPALATEVFRRESNALVHGGKVLSGPDGKPRNPAGRTGMIGRGLLGKWGPNYAADPIVTRFDPTTSKLQMVAIQRVDTEDWAIPGGMVDAGEHVSVTLRREFYEEAQNLEGEQAEHIKEKLDALFKKGERVFVGYVDDPRNTDNAWMETSAYHFHIDDAELAEKLTLAAGDDAKHVRWLDVDDAVPEFKALYASHRAIVSQAVVLAQFSPYDEKDDGRWRRALERISGSSKLA